MNLVIQGPECTPADAQEAARLARSASIQTVAARAFRILGAQPSPGVAQWCEARRIDHAWMSEGRRFADLKLLALDMDSTLITIECIDELGDFAGRKAEVAAITGQAMRGEMDYPESLRRRVAVLAGLPASILDEVYEKRLRLTAGAEALVAACKRNGVKVLLVSGGFSYFTERLKARLGLDYTISNVLEIEDGRLTGRVAGPVVAADAKAARFREAAKALDAEPRHTVAIGDGANDLEMMAEAGVSIAFRAKPAVRAKASCALDWSGLDAVVNLFE